jgi:hypothetical protein
LWQIIVARLDWKHFSGKHESVRHEDKVATKNHTDEIYGALVLIDHVKFLPQVAAESLLRKWRPPDDTAVCSKR